MVSVFQRDIKTRRGVAPAPGLILFPNQSEVAEVLFANRFIQMVFGLDSALDFRRCGFAFAIKRAAGGHFNQDKRQEADNEQKRRDHEQSFEEVHCQKSGARASYLLLPVTCQLVDFPYNLQRVLIEDVLIDTLDFVGVKVVEAGVKVDRHNGDLLRDENGLGLAEQRRTPLQVGLQVGLADDVVVAGVVPAGAVVAAIAQKHIEERVRVVVVANPTGGREVVVQARLRAVKDLALNLAQLDLDAQFLSPHLLQLNGDFAWQSGPAAGGGVKGVLQGGKTFAAGIACRCQELAGLLRVESGSLRGRIVGDTFRDEMVRGLFAAHGDLFNDALPVGSQRKGPADASIVQRFTGDVEAIKVGAQIVVSVEIGAFHQHVQQFGRHQVFVPDDIGDVGFVQVQRGVGRADGQNVNDLALSVGRVPIIRVLAETDFVIETPGDELIGAAGGQRAFAEPAVAAPGDGLPRHHGQRRKGAKVQEKRQRMFQLNLQQVSVERANADEGRVLDFAVVIIFGIFDVEELAGVITRRGGAERAHPGIDHVLGCDGLAGGPGGLGAQVKSVNLAVRGDIPSFSQTRYGLSGFGVEPEQPLEERLGDAHLGN